MRYAVISCPRCGRNRIAETKSGTSGCPSCGRRFELAKARRHFETDSQEQARFALTALNSGNSDTREKVGEQTGEDGDVQALKSIGGQLERAVAVAKTLSTDKGDFSSEDFIELAARADIKNPAKVLESAVDAGDVFEPKPGRYRAL